MEWLNLPLIEGALCVGALVGLLGGFFAGYGIESWTGYNRGFKAGYERAKKERDTE